MDPAETLRTAVNDPTAHPLERLRALENYQTFRQQRLCQGLMTPTPADNYAEVNNHIHTIYSFSPYSPAMAALKAQEAGLAVAGSVDHDSIGAAREMTAACRLLGLGACSGFELRVAFKQQADGRPSRFANRKLNNPDSVGLAYITVQGVPAKALPRVQRFLEPIHQQRNQRNRRMLAAVNRELAAAGIAGLDFKRDLYDQSKAAEGGSITERHLLAAMARRLIDTFGRGPAMAVGLAENFGLEANPKTAAYLADPANPHYLFDLLAFLKASFLERVFIQPTDSECIPAPTVINFARSISAIPAYAYLGDVNESPTGDKKAEKFEDAFLDELFDELTALGFKAITYMPPRNSLAQLKRVQQLCAERSFMEISGVDINSPRQSFNCPEVLHSAFRHLIDTTWALVAHERLSNLSPELDLFAAANPYSEARLPERLAAYAKAGQALVAAERAADGNSADLADSQAAIIDTIRHRRFP